ncbi:MAG: signal peptidase II [Deltaproteobacteria bacterium]|nr:signal peptidase II [Deltaproteobacteria bacterium]
MMRALALLALLVPCVACDQATKALAVLHLKGSAGDGVVGDGFFRLVYAENPGAFLGLGRALPDALRTALFVVGVAAVLIGVAVFALRRRPPWPVFLGLGLLVAGGLGNLVDRVARDGRVVDFAVLRVGPLQTGIFNVADVQIVAAAFLLVTGTWHRRRADEDAGGGHPPDPVAAG